MRGHFNNDIVEHCISKADLEDRIYLLADKIVALCSVQAALDAGDYVPSPRIRNHYSLILEEQAVELRSLLDTLFVDRSL